MLSATQSLVLPVTVFPSFESSLEKGTLNRGKEKNSGTWVLTTQQHLADIPGCKCQSGEPSIYRENTWSQNWGKIYLEGNSLQEAVTCTDVKSSIFRMTLHILHIWCCWKRNVSILSIQTQAHTPTHHISSVPMSIWQFPEILHLADSTEKIWR